MALLLVRKFYDRLLFNGIVLLFLFFSLSFFVCSLLVELCVVPSISSSGEKLFHQSAEEAYESGIHAVHSSEGQKTLWKEYIFYLRGKAESGGKEDFLRLVDGVHRCLMDVDCFNRAIPLDSQCVDYCFHNEVRFGFLRNLYYSFMVIARC